MSVRGLFHRLSLSVFIPILRIFTHWCFDTINIVRAVALLFLPTAVWLVADGATERVCGGVLVVGLTLFVAIYLKDTFMFFLEKKVSIFNWFLYLCTAILLPLSFLATLLPRVMV